MNETFADDEIKTQREFASSRMLTSSPPKQASSIRTTPSPLKVAFRGYTPWSVQANYSTSRLSKRSGLSSGCHGNLTEYKAKESNVEYKTCKEKLETSNPWRIISAPSSYSYSHVEGSFTNGRGCTWTPHYFTFYRPPQTTSTISKEGNNECSDSKPSPGRINLPRCKELKPTQSWIWSNHPRVEKITKKETFANLMKSPYLRWSSNRVSSRSYSSQSLLSSRKCEAWLKSNT